MGHHDLHESEHKPHILDLKIYLNVGLGLIVLTILTVYTAKFMPEHILEIFKLELNPVLSLTIAFIIAFVKACLVVFFFMHLKYDNKFLLYTLSFGIFFCAVFFILTLADTLTRTDKPFAHYGEYTPKKFLKLTEIPKSSFLVPSLPNYTKDGNLITRK